MRKLNETGYFNEAGIYLMMKYLVQLLLFFTIAGCKTAGVTMQDKHNFLAGLMEQRPLEFAKVLANKDSLRIQIIYTKIDRDANNRPHFTDYYFNTSSSKYFYPASTVKMPVALLALEKINQLAVPGLTRYSKMNAGERPAADSAILTPKSVAEYIKEIFLVSDNNAFNSLYEFLGQQYIKEQLDSKGYTFTEIRHRLQIPLTAEQNRITNAIDFYDQAGNVIYHQPGAYSHINFSVRNDKIGSGFVSNDTIVHQPFDCSKKNRISLQDLHSIMRSVIFPDEVAAKSRFNLTGDDYNFIYRYMSAYPRESKKPFFDSATYHDNYSKFLLFGAEKTPPPSYLRIFNKEGDAYGFLNDIAYIVDFKNKTEFFLSATILCNSDGIFNDEKYDYDSVGLPFLKNLGRAVYEYELKRKKKHAPDLGRFKIDYTNEWNAD